MNRLLPTTLLAVLAVLASTAIQAEPDIANGQLIAMGGRESQVETACFRCHGIDGAGDSSGAFPRLTGQFAEYLTKQMHDYANGSRPNDIMTPIAEALSEQEWADVSAFYAQLQAPDRGRQVTDLSAVQRGSVLSASGSAERGIQACINCHGPAGSGIAPHYPYLAGQFSSYMELQLQFWKQGIRNNDPLNVMKDIAVRLTDEEARAVSLYFESMRPVGSGDGGDAVTPRSASRPGR